MQLDGGKLIPSPVHLSVNENTVEKNCLGSTEGGREGEKKKINLQLSKQEHHV